MRRLIVTADDFGWSPSVNEAVLKAHEDGILRYASLMVDGDAAEEAARLARKAPGLGVGLHLDLCRRDPALHGLKYFFLPGWRGRLEGEIRRQFKKLKALGIKPTHADGHFNIQAHPVIFPILARVAREEGVPRLRLPGGEAGVSAGFGRDGLLSRTVTAGVFALIRAGVAGSRGELELPERTWGLLRSGTMREDYLLWLLERIPEGTTEVYFHPCADPATAVTDRPTPTHHTVTELEALTSPRVREALERSGALLAGEGPGPAPGGGARRT